MVNAQGNLIFYRYPQMKDMNHTRLQDELSAYLDNELAPAMRKRVEAHLLTCEECRDMLSAFQQNTQEIRALEQPAPSIKASVIEKIHEQLQDELSAYLDNELAPTMHKRIEAHLHSCNECSDTLSVFSENRKRIKVLEHLAPSSIADTVMAKIREQAAKPRLEKSSHTPKLRDIGRWLPDLGRWFLRPVTAGATGVLTLAVILGFLYLYPTTPQYEEAFDFYFGLYTEQLADNPLKSNVGLPLRPSPAAEPASTEPADDAELFLDLYLGNAGY